MLTLYFSGTGNSKYIAQVFSEKMGAQCLSIEDDAELAAQIKAHDTIAFCYPIYGSRVPMIMREFAARHMDALAGKKLVILVTQLIFSGDGARVLIDLFPKRHVEVIYAAHLIMPNNVCNFALLRQASEKRTRKQLHKAERQLARICQDIKHGIVKKRGFSAYARVLGSMQGVAWMGGSHNVTPAKGSMEFRAMRDVKIHEDCNACGLCVKACPMNNLRNEQGKIAHNNNCTVCYRCINLCPNKAITVFFHQRPKWQFKGFEVSTKS